MKDFFKPKDFDLHKNEPQVHTEAISPRIAAAMANAKFEKLIESWPLYYCRESLGSYHTFTVEKFKNSTHAFRLAFIEEIVKEPELCKCCGQEIKK